MGEQVLNHCASCGKPIEPEEQFCPECATHQEACAVCGKVICECEVPGGD